jgi:hypothetical protein
VVCGWSICFSPGYKALDAAFQSRTFDHDGMMAFQALQADIRAQSGNYPLIAAARMRLFQADHITCSQFNYHFRSKNKLCYGVSKLPLS